MTGISWTDETWNPWAGCFPWSPGCTNCYAMRDAWRISHHPTAAPWYKGTVKLVNGRPVWTGQINRADQPKFEEPLRWREPRIVFVDSMSDFMAVAPAWRTDALAIMARCPQHRFLVLTKRAEFLDRLPSSLPSNIWVGVSVERADFAWRLDHLRAVDASIRFVSAEPLLGPLDDLDLSGIAWLIVGGESGAREDIRPFDPAWARSLREQCAAAGVAFHMKQMGGATPAERHAIPDDLMVREWPPF